MRVVAIAGMFAVASCSFDTSGPSFAGDAAGTDAPTVDTAVIIDGSLFADAAVDAPVVDALVDGMIDAPIPDAQVPDAALPDAPPDAPGTVFGYVPSNFDPADLSPAGDVVLNCGVSQFNSTSLGFTNWCGAPEPTPVVAGGMVILPMTSLTIVSGNGLQLRGARPVILAVYGDATIAGIIDARGTATTPGAGGSDATICGTSTGEAGTKSGDNGGGGGGGGMGSAGGDGGNGGVGALLGSGGDVVSDVVLVPLRGGCSGGPGGDSDTHAGGLGGAGGGGVQLSAAGSMTLTGRVTASGGGGRAAARRAGAGGGGSGGGILLEGDVVSIGATAQITANGGGGGEGGANVSTDVNDHGDNGSPNTASPASGGSGLSGSGGDGGNGGAGATAPTNGANGNSPAGGGGGGGGAAGITRLNAGSLCAIVGTPVLSPAPTSNGASGCP